MQKHTTGKTCSIADGLTATTAPKTKASRLWLESRDASRTALPRSLLTTSLHSDLHCGNGSNVPLGCAACQFSTARADGRLFHTGPCCLAPTPDGLTSLLVAVNPGCALRLFPSALTDFVAEVRNLVVDFGPRFFTG